MNPHLTGPNLRWALIVAVPISAVALSGCSAYYIDEVAPELSREAVIGVWSHGGPAGLTASIVLAADGTFTATDIPKLSTPASADIRAGKVEDDPIVDWSKLKHGSGTWSIHDDSDGSAPALDLSYATTDDDLVHEPMSGGAFSSLLSLAEAGSTRLFFYVDDADLKYRFLFTKD